MLHILSVQPSRTEQEWYISQISCHKLKGKELYYFTLWATTLFMRVFQFMLMWTCK